MACGITSTCELGSAAARRSIAGTRSEPLVALADAVNAWLSTRLQSGPQETRRLARVGEIWADVNRAMRDAEAYNLDRKQHVLSMIARLNDTFRM